MAELFIDFSDPTEIFGSESADFERDDELFRTYFLERPIAARFLDARKPLRVVMAYKGEGKSALLRHIGNTLRDAAPKTGALVMEVGASRMSPNLDSLDFEEWVRAWKGQIMAAVAAEVGRELKVPWTADQQELLDHARAGGFRSEGMIGGLLRRLPDKFKLNVLGVEGGFEVVSGEDATAATA